MTTQDWIQLGIMSSTVIGVIITSIALIITLRNFKKQLQLTFFADYTKRFQDISLNLPQNIYDPAFDYSQIDKDLQNKTLKYMRAYFDLCSEEYDLWKRGAIEDRIWKEWSGRMKFLLSKKSFQEGWEKIEYKDIYEQEFASFILGMIKDTHRED